MAGQKRAKKKVAGGAKKRRREEQAEAAGAAEEAEAEEDEEDEEAEDAKGAAKVADAPPEVEDDDDDEEEDESEEEIHDGEDDNEEAEEEEEEGEENGVKKIFRPGVDELKEGEKLDVAPGSYDMLHIGQVEWPCLSFDILRDDLGAQRKSYPMTAYVVAGTQAKNRTENKLYMMKWSKLCKTSKDGREEESEDDNEEEDGEESSDSEDEDREAKLEWKAAAHPGGVNRIRAMPQAGHIVATWADTGKVHMWNLQPHRQALDRATERVATNPKPIHTCEAHMEEGYAMDWSPHDMGKFLSGSNDGKAFLWEPVQGGWKVQNDQPFTGHSSSVEDIQWKKLGNGKGSLFASCSSDCSVRVWDIREKSRSKSAVHIKDAHGSDVNVLSWSPCVGELLVTGSDDGGFKIWDTRNVSAGPMANFLWHKKPITSVDWHPTDETVLCVASEDHMVSLWDMAVEDDRVGQEKVPGESHFPPQLLFVHMGQQDPKEVRWHPQIPSVCIATAASGFNIFKTCNI